MRRSYQLFHFTKQGGKFLGMRKENLDLMHRTC